VTVTCLLPIKSSKKAARSKFCGLLFFIPVHYFLWAYTDVDRVDAGRAVVIEGLHAVLDFAVLIVDALNETVDVLCVIHSHGRQQ
jgi:hypothetical protein